MFSITYYTQSSQPKRLAGNKNATASIFYHQKLPISHYVFNKCILDFCFELLKFVCRLLTILKDDMYLKNVY